MAYVLGKKSMYELAHDGQEVHPELVAMVKQAITITPVDFSVHDGLRTRAEQTEMVRTGASQTMNSYHLADAKYRPRGLATKYGQAVDLVPYVNGKNRWEWALIYPIAAAMGDSLGYINPLNRIRWGAVWDRTLDQLDLFDLESEVQAYAKRRRDLGKRVFQDGPHFQIEVHV